MRQLIALVLLLSCSSEPAPTTVRLAVVYEESWGLEGLRLEARDIHRELPLASEVLVVVPDGWAGQSLLIELEGLKAGDAYAYGATTVIPLPQYEVIATVVLAPLCGDGCTAGAVECRGDTVVTCEADGDGCTHWSEPVPCSGGTHCSLGQCSTTCTDECAEGESRCVGAMISACGQADGDSCRDWLDAEACPMGEACSGAECRPSASCTDECMVDVCDGTRVRECGTFDADSCRELSTPMACPAPTNATATCTGAGICGFSCESGYERCGATCCPETVSLPQVTAGGSHTCGVRTSGTVACWGYNGGGQATPPAGTFASVSAGGEHTCGVRMTGTVACWGFNDDGRATPPAGTFTSVSAGGWHTCGVRPTGTVTCWGNDEYGRSTPPAGSFGSVSAGLEHTCGVRTTGTVACWGFNDDDRSTPPAGSFASVSAGLRHTCGVRTNDTVTCWGDNVAGQSTPPAGTFASVSAGGYHTCGVRTDGTVACWGFNGDGQSSSPTGSFVSVSAGLTHTCGVRTDGTVACWGRNNYGQVTLPAGW